MPVLVLLSVVGVRSAWSKTIYFIFNTEETPTKYLYGRKYAAYNKDFRQIFPEKIFPDISLIFSKIPAFPWQQSYSLTIPGFPDKWSPCATAYTILCIAKYSKKPQIYALIMFYKTNMNW